MGGHKAAAIAAVLKKARVYLVSSLPAEALGRIGLVPFDDLDQALTAAGEVVGTEARIWALPYGDSVLPQAVA